ncbi:unnamed protein product [Toxocara canis]|uniref:J domain-containing protein n=1 Tax=Toxocara canis TaxID=6265 RepID=A0A183UD83_TOXCA|nr:unnamed protein product [Toxocara canis]
MRVLFQVHPDSDSHLSEEERERRQRAFVELKAAYDVLRRPADRRIYDERLSGRMHPQYTAARQHRYHNHNYGPSTQYENFGCAAVVCYKYALYGSLLIKVCEWRAGMEAFFFMALAILSCRSQDWKAFWASTSGYKAEHMTAEDFKKQHEKQWAVVIRYTLIALGIVLAYHIGYLYAFDHLILFKKSEIVSVFLSVTFQISVLNEHRSPSKLLRLSVINHGVGVITFFKDRRHHHCLTAALQITGLSTQSRLGIVGGEGRNSSIFSATKGVCPPKKRSGT